jgi:hypothetical protein
MEETYMEAVYRLRPHELTDSFFKTLKAAFFDKEIQLSVREVDRVCSVDSGEDTTAYLLSSPENRKALLEGIEAAKSGRYVRTMTLEEAETLAL